MELTLNGFRTCNGEWVKTALKFTKRDDGTWHRMDFGDQLEETGKGGAAQSAGWDTRKTETSVRRQLSAQELVELSGKYDPRHMSQDQYDAFLNELVEKGALTSTDKSWLGYGGLQRLDVNMDKLFDAWAEGRPGCGTAYVTSAGSSIPGLSLEDAEGDLLRWLGNMLARMTLGIDPSTEKGSREKEDTVNALRDIIRRM